MKRVLGVCYYPEHWPEDIWAEDARRMADAGLTLVRIGEFAWSRLEPVPGDLRLDWLDRAIDVLADAGLKIVLGTPTATPPRWMLDRHPDMLGVDTEGRARKFGSRRHYCFSHPGYREECARIVDILARRYGDNPNIAAWQTDNEYGCHDTVLSYSDAARAGFQVWLADKYGQIDSLNSAWGNVFWSMDYRTYAQIDLPNLTVTEANPAHVLDFMRYSSDQVADFNRAQAQIIRAHSPAPIAHNYMGRTLSFDHFQTGADLEIASWDSYPLGFLEDRSDRAEDFRARFMRQGDPDNQAFHHDLYRAVGDGRWWVMEQQPGPVNWAPYNPAPLPGMVRLWSWEAFAHGAEAVCYFRWRQAPFAQEQMHAGLLRPDSQAAPALAEAAQVAQELADIPDVGTGDKEAAIIFDYESAWAWQVQPQGQAFDYFRIVFDMYRGLRRLGLNIDFVPKTTTDFGGYKLILCPALLGFTDSLRRALEQADARVLIGPRSGSKTADMAIPTDLPPDWPELGLVVSRVESLRPGAQVDLGAGGSFMIWAEECEVTSGIVAEARADGLPALITSGHLSYLAGWPDDVAMDRVLRDVATRAGLDPMDLPAAVRVRKSGGRTYWFNYGTDAVPAGKIPGLDTALPVAGVHIG